MIVFILICVFYVLESFTINCLNFKTRMSFFNHSGMGKKKIGLIVESAKVGMMIHVLGHLFESAML